jgi:hypothetical protein
MAASQTTKRKVKDKTPVMEGQTEEERRILRQEQRTLYDRIGDRNVDLQDLDHDAFDEERNNNNNLFKKVRFNREMVNDGDILVQLSEAAMKRAGKLAKNVSQYSAADIGKALSQDFTKAGGDMDWVALGAQCAGLFRAVPEASFLCGPLQKPEKEKKAAQRRKKVVDDGEEETQYETTSGFKEGAAQARFFRVRRFFLHRGRPRANCDRGATHQITFFYASFVQTPGEHQRESSPLARGARAPSSRRVIRPGARARGPTPLRPPLSHPPSGTES